MLVLTRKIGESITIGNDINLSILTINGKSVQVGITAPKHIRILRQEIYLKIQEENRKAANISSSMDIKALAQMFNKSSQNNKNSVISKAVLTKDEVV